MKKLTLLIAMCLMITAFTNAQIIAMRATKLTSVKSISLKKAITNSTTPVKLRRCGTAESYAYLMANDPVYRAQREETEKQVAEWIAAHPESAEAKTSYTIPVVVHVLFYSSTSDPTHVSVAQVQSQITATNADWAGLNTHSMDAFPTSLKANTGVQFCLAVVDPNGNATNGIDYKQTTVTSFNITGSGINSTGYPERSTTTGGANAWDVTKYFNVWVCKVVSNSSGELCGISVFPTASNTAYYGSTINYKYFGTTAQAQAPYNLGGTLSHEAGHCFNLYHTWGDDGGPCSGTDNCGDTPNSGNMNYGNIEDGSLAEQSTATSTLHTTSSPKYETDGCTTTSPGVLFQDFMDYSDDIDYACFTPNQVSRIQAIAAGDDLSITTSGKCNASVAPVAAFVASATAVNVGATVTFTDQSTNTPTSWQWTLTPSTGFTYASGSATAQNPQITFNTAGTYTVALKATNGVGNNTCTKTNYITVTAPTSAPVAAFIANATNVVSGTTVIFTDQSTNSPTSWLWTLTPSTGFTYITGSATAQNPHIQFTAVGTYTVALKATNGVGNNTCTKTNYITVTAPTAGCDTLWPKSFLTGTCYDSLTLYVPDAVTPLDSGYITGQNAYKFTELAEKYTMATPLANASISDVVVLYALKNVSTNSNTTVKIYSNTGGLPGTVLGTSAVITKSAIDTTNQGINYNNRYHFATPVAVAAGTTYFISVVLPTTFTTGTDELAIWDENIACSAVDSGAYFKFSTWRAFNSTTNGFGVNIDMAILPVICTTVGINEVTLDKNINLYPNPTNSQFTVDFSMYQQSNVEINVYNMVGKLVKTVSSKDITDKMIIDMSNQSSGIYIVNIKTPAGTIIKKLSLIK
jgi:PKD repeat protein